MFLHAFAVQRLSEQPGVCVAVEDNAGEVRAASAAGLPCVAFSTRTPGVTTSATSASSNA